MNPSMLIVLLLLSLLATFIGNLMILVAAFRQSILWGLASLFVPFAQLFFMLRHWDAARKGFLLGLGGAALMGFALFSMPDRAQYLGRFLPESYTNSWGAPSASQTAQIKELTEKIRQQREHIRKLEGEFSQANITLTSQYQAITDKRKALKSDDPAAVNQFNEDAAAYHQLNNRVKQMPGALKTAKQELDALLIEGSKHQSAAKPTGAQPEPPPAAGQTHQKTEELSADYAD